MSGIGDFIKERRRLLNMSQQTLADKVGVSKSAISRYESGEIGNMGVDKAKKLADALRVDPLIFVDREIVQLSKKTIFVDDNFEVISQVRKVSPIFRPVFGEQLLAMTIPVEEESTPSRAEILSWLADNVRTAAYGGSNYEDFSDEDLLAFYLDIRQEFEDD